MSESDEIDEREMELLVRRQPPPPSLLSGVFTFPWHMNVLRPWFLFGLGFTAVFLLGGAVRHVIQLHQESSEVGHSIYFRVLILFFKALVLAFLWTGSFAASYCLATIQETAAGGDRISRPDNSISEKLFQLLYILYVTMWTAVPLGFLGAAVELLLPGHHMGVLVVPLFVFLFPVFLLSSLATDSYWKFLHLDLITGLFERPLVVVLLLFGSILVMAPCSVLAYFAIIETQYFLAPLAGFAWSAGVLVYARMLGRIGRIVSGPYESGGSRKRLKRRSRTAD